jgi:hypothetical protein
LPEDQRLIGFEADLENGRIICSSRHTRSAARRSCRPG